MITALIVDDEPGCRESLEHFVDRHCPQLTVVGMADSVATAWEAIREHQPQLVFLDVEMPMGTGFDLLKSLPKIDFEVIFVTAYDQYAIQAFRFSAIDYLLKPINILELKAAAEKVQARIEGAGRQQHYDVLLDNVADPRALPRKVAFPTSKGLSFCEVSDIVRCQANDNYTTIFLLDGTKFMISKTVKWVDELLSDFEFFRVHQSHLVSLAHIKEYQRTAGGSILMIDGTEVPISQRKKEGFLKLIKRK